MPRVAFFYLYDIVSIIVDEGCERLDNPSRCTPDRVGSAPVERNAKMLPLIIGAEFHMVRFPKVTERNLQDFFDLTAVYLHRTGPFQPP